MWPNLKTPTRKELFEQFGQSRSTRSFSSKSHCRCCLHPKSIEIPQIFRGTIVPDRVIIFRVFRGGREGNRALLLHSTAKSHPRATDLNRYPCTGTSTTVVLCPQYPRHLHYPFDETTVWWDCIIYFYCMMCFSKSGITARVRVVLGVEKDFTGAALRCVE